MISWGRMIADGLMMTGAGAAETPLMRMFRIEYPREYSSMKKLNCEFNDRTVRQFLRTQKR